MTGPQILLSAIVIQQAFLGLLWVGMVNLRATRRVAWHWAGGTLLLAVAMSVMVARSSLPAWISVFGGNVALLASVTLARRGVQIFVGTPLRDREQALCMLASGAALALGTAAGPDFVVIVVAVSTGLAWTFGRATVEIVRHLAREFGQRTARACAVPFGILGLSFALRATGAIVAPEVFARSVVADAPVNVVAAMLALLVGLILSATLLSLVIVRLVRQLQHASNHDQLTGVLNRRGMARQVTIEEHRRVRHGTTFALLSVDIDNFKRINDLYGHEAGDSVLNAVAASLSGCVRLSDTVARMGGEEFSLLLPDTDLEGAQALAGRVMDAVRKLEFAAIDTRLQVTVSVGVASAADVSETFEDLQRRVDRALYAAKAAGRDRAELAQPARAQAPGEALLEAA
jgi:diguanylate cyclase (GGDEF)-like protein